VQTHFELRKTKLELDRAHQEIRKTSGSIESSYPTLTAQAKTLLDSILNNVQSLSKNDTRDDQATYLKLITESVISLKGMVERV
jgi:hypothetical protein